MASLTRMEMSETATSVIQTGVSVAAVLSPATLAGAGALAGLIISGPIGVIPGAVFGSFMGGSNLLSLGVSRVIPSIRPTTNSRVSLITGAVLSIFTHMAIAWGLSMACGTAMTFTAALVLGLSTVGLYIAGVLALGIAVLIILALGAFIMHKIGGFENSFLMPPEGWTKV